jgi:hypothetical protein
MTNEQSRFGVDDIDPAYAVDDMDADSSSDTVVAHPSGHSKPTGIAKQMVPSERKFIAYTIKLPSEQLAALQSIWLELKRLYGANSPDKSGMIQQAVEDWLKRWDGPDKDTLLDNLLEIRQDTRRRQYKK